MKKIARVFDIIENLNECFEKEDMLNSKIDKRWKHISTSDFYDAALHVAYALHYLKLQKNDNVVLMSNNRFEWNFVDYGVQQAGMILVPVYPTISNDDLKYILNHCEAKIIFISDKVIYKKLTELENQLPHLKFVISFNAIEGVKHFSEFMEMGAENPIAEKIELIKKEIKPNDLLTILYTSGTTGQPKGVMLSHDNFISLLESCKYILDFKSTWKALSFLPLNHVYERFINTLYLYHGISIYYAESFETIGDNCREIHPQVFVAVPRIFERVFERISSAGKKLSGIKKYIFNWSLALAERYELNKANGFFYELQRSIADKLVYNKWRNAIGGNIVAIISGGAALNPRLERIFTCAKIKMMQGYGLTETSPVISVNRFESENTQFGTVGLVLDKIEVKIAEEDGEILMKGPSLMLGYYKNEDETKAVIDTEGWFHTGDVGVFVDEKFLKITDRKKEIFKNSAGKYIAPMMLENKLKESELIEQCMIVGEGQKFTSALIVPNMINFKEYCTQNKIEWVTEKEMLASEELKKNIFNHIKEMNKTLAPHEQLKRCEIVDGNWSVEGGEITPKLSLKRKVISKKYEKEIQKIFSIEA
ncbi:MAG: long-chain fatty acid--CoA ligase [Bacteroidetes bacterium]|nr:long-chain fatty acid--CoA ligase [Bacteroidota bacterium]